MQSGNLNPALYAFRCLPPIIGIWVSPIAAAWIVVATLAQSLRVATWQAILDLMYRVVHIRDVHVVLKMQSFGGFIFGTDSGELR